MQTVTPKSFGTAGANVKVLRPANTIVPTLIEALAKNQRQLEAVPQGLAGLEARQFLLGIVAVRAVAFAAHFDGIGAEALANFGRAYDLAATPWEPLFEAALCAVFNTWLRTGCLPDAMPATITAEGQLELRDYIPARNFSKTLAARRRKAPAFGENKAGFFGGNAKKYAEKQSRAEARGRW